MAAGGDKELTISGDDGLKDQGEVIYVDQSLISLIQANNIKTQRILYFVLVNIQDLVKM